MYWSFTKEVRAEQRTGAFEPSILFELKDDNTSEQSGTWVGIFFVIFVIVKKCINVAIPQVQLPVSSLAFRASNGATANASSLPENSSSLQFPASTL